MTRRWLLAMFVGAALSVAPTDGPGQPPERTSEIRKAAEQLVDGLELESLQGETWVRAKRIDRPLLLYSDDTRADDRGSLWAWGDKGRPLATLEMFQKATSRTVWTINICNTSGGRL